MEEEFVIVNLRPEFVFLVRLVVAAVEKSAAIFFPRRSLKLDPVENIWSILAGLDVAHFPLLPIGAGGRETISHQFGVIGHVHAAHCDCAVFRQHIWIEKLARLFEKVRRDVKNVLVLQTGVLGKKVTALFFEGNPEPLVIPDFSQTLPNSVPLRNRFQKIECDFVFRLDPRARFGRVRIFQWTVRISDFGAVIIVHLIARWRGWIFELRRRIGCKNERERRKDEKRKEFAVHKLPANMPRSKNLARLILDRGDWPQSPAFRGMERALR